MAICARKQRSGDTTMSAKTKIVLLSAAIVLSTAFAASAATKPRVTQANQSAAYNLIPGYDKYGRTVGIPDPDQSAR
jgi:hypothetical protein